VAEFTREDTLAKVVEVVINKLGVEKEVILKSNSFQELGADSLDMVEILMKLEEQFGIEINDKDAEKLSSLDQAINYIHDLRKK